MLLSTVTFEQSADPLEPDALATFADAVESMKPGAADGGGEYDGERDPATEQEPQGNADEDGGTATDLLHGSLATVRATTSVAPVKTIEIDGSLTSIISAEIGLLRGSQCAACINRGANCCRTAEVPAPPAPIDVAVVAGQRSV